MVPRGLEPRTLRLLAVRSNRLSYETLVSLVSIWVAFWVEQGNRGARRRMLEAQPAGARRVVVFGERTRKRRGRIFIPSLAA